MRAHLLLVRVVVLAHDGVQPVGVLDARHGVGHLGRVRVRVRVRVRIGAGVKEG